MFLEVSEVNSTSCAIMLFNVYLELLNNNWINAKYRQIVFRSLSNGALIIPNQQSFGIPVKQK